MIKRHKYTLTFDPGTKAAGVALFYGQRLIDVLLIKKAGDGWAANRAIPVAIETADAIVQRWPFLLEHAEQANFVCEYPQFYAHGGTPGSGDNILCLALVVGALGMEMMRRGFPNPKLVRPATWKSQTKKEIMTGRIELCCAPCEIISMEHVKAPRSKKIDHNVLDAVGIGFGELGRIPLAGTPINMWLRTNEQLKEFAHERIG